MKKISAASSGVVLLLLILCRVMQAQPWSPLNLNEKFNYRGDGYDFITNTIWIDSVKTGSGDSPPLPWFVLVPGTVLMYQDMFKPGLGQSYHHLAVFEWEEEHELVGYIKNGDTTGYIYPDDFILEGLRRRDDSHELLIYPNPADDFLQVGRDFQCMGLEAEIRNINGILIKKVLFTGTINISDLFPGYYFISIIKKGHEKPRNGKFIKR